jgi:transcriptional regulator with XRE-family HTH domain
MSHAQQAASVLNLGRFLKEKRQSLAPADLGLPPGKRRRVAGLRREEVASRAAIGIDWYIALEQGRDVRPSEHVLSGLADALLMTTGERDHLFALAGRMPPTSSAMESAQVNTALERLIDRMQPNPAYVLDASWRALAWNDAAAELFQIDLDRPVHPGNVLWDFFVVRPRPDDPQWRQIAQFYLSLFRRQAAAYANDPNITRLIDDLGNASAVFTALWKETSVLEVKGGRKSVIHPVEGIKTFDYSALAVPDIAGAYLLVYFPVSALGEDKT